MKGTIIISNRIPKGLLLSAQGSILVYIVLTMVIFGILGVTMVSLFSTSISSSATQNDTRRAIYLSEAGSRYAMSEMLNADFAKTTIGSLNSTEYSLGPLEKFKINVFSPWFEPELNVDLGANFSDSDTRFDIQEGNLPTGLMAKLPASSSGLLLVNYDYIDISGGAGQNPPAYARAVVTGGAEVVGEPLKLDLELGDDIGGQGFVAGRNETVAFAVKPFSDLTNAPLPTNILLQPIAARVFPSRNGAIEVNRHNFYYEQAIDRTTHLELTNVRRVEGETIGSLSVSAADDYIILNPRNRYIISEGHSGEVYFGNHFNYASAIADISVFSPESLRPDIEFDQEADLPRVLPRVEPSTGDVVNFGGELGNRFVTLSTSNRSFGAFWFRDPDSRSIGGVRNFCNNLGGCLFNDGFRAFFILKFTGNSSGDGLAFSIVNASNNTVGSIGGDIDLSELLAYAGDSRTVSNPTLASQFLDGRSGQGLLAPKFAVEFDGLENNQFASICEDGSTLNIGTRNDPDVSGASRDAVQYVFWGSNNTLINAPCRINTLLDPDTNRTYDDNRHDGVNAVWTFDSGSAMLSSPAIDESDPADIRIYTGQSTENALSNGGRLIRLRGSDGTAEWTENPNDPPLPPSPPPLNDGDVNSAPELDSAGNIYIGNDDNLLAKYSPGGTKLASIFLDGDIEGKPAVSNLKDTVYAVTDNGSLHALNRSDLTPKWATPFDITVGFVGGTFSSWPVIRYDAVLDNNVAYVGSLDGRLYAVRDNGASGTILNANFPIATGGAIRGTPAIHPTSGDVYFGSDDGQVRARTSQGVARWAVTPAPSAAIVASPAVDAGADRVYVGSTNGRLYALSDLANGAEVWKYPDPVRTPGDPTRIGDIRGAPAIASDGAIIFGADDGYLYALNPSGTLRWKFPTAGSPLGAIRSKPAIGANGIIYFGANDGKLYAVDPAANDPPNIRELQLTSADLGGSFADADNWFLEGPWAVRVEVERERFDSNADGKFTYTLKTWLKKCADADCTNIVGTTFFQNTRFAYDWATAGITPMTQVFDLSNTPDSFHDRFDRFLFGFTSASNASQTIEIRRFQLSFIRPNDPVASD
jgi:outer membrane protein assembly factor BamB